MLTSRMRETLMHELHAHKAPVDAVAAYLSLMDKYMAGGTGSVPCPRCYADGVDHPLVIVPVETEAGSTRCSECRTAYEFGVQSC